MLPLPIAFAVKGSFELAIVVGFFIAMNLYEQKYGYSILPVSGTFGDTVDSVYVKRTHKNVGSYFCPENCGADHPHRAHKSSYNCQLENPCDHYKYYVDSEGLVRRENTSTPKDRDSKSDLNPELVAGDI
tara:strand:- start:2822 stop:3211 length:390 start_codon:yes stop_codon:yes gene_type:complete